MNFKVKVTEPWPWDKGSTFDIWDEQQVQELRWYHNNLVEDYKFSAFSRIYKQLQVKIASINYKEKSHN